jgi:hypothetical protein
MTFLSRQRHSDWLLVKEWPEQKGGAATKGTIRQSVE